MLSVRILCVGKLKESYWREACAEYSKRLSAFCRFEIDEVEESRVPENASKAQIDAALQAEGRRLLERVPAGCRTIALCIEGRELSSEALAASMDSAMVGGVSSMAFLIGGSWGLSRDVKQQCNRRISMSPMTFPHQLARVMICEQIYRAFQISSGGKYHK